MNRNIAAYLLAASLLLSSASDAQVIVPIDLSNDQPQANIHQPSPPDNTDYTPNLKAGTSHAPHQSGRDLPDIKFGDSFTKWRTSFVAKSTSPNSYCASYEYTKTITTSYYGHRIQKLIVSVRDNIVVRKILLFVPNSGDVDVPAAMREEMESNLGYKFSHVNDSYGSTYGLSVNGTLITVSRMNNEISEGRDRIVMVVAGRGACR